MNKKDLTGFKKRYSDEAFIIGMFLFFCISLLWFWAYTVISKWNIIWWILFLLILVGIILWTLILCKKQEENDKKQEELNNSISDYYNPLIDDIRKYSISLYENEEELNKILTNISVYLNDILSNSTNNEFISIISTVFSKDVNWGKTKMLLEKLHKKDLVSIDILLKRTKNFIIETPLQNLFNFKVPYKGGQLEIKLDINDFLKILESVK